MCSLEAEHTRNVQVAYRVRWLLFASETTKSRPIIRTGDRLIFESEEDERMCDRRRNGSVFNFWRQNRWNLATESDVESVAALFCRKSSRSPPNESSLRNASDARSRLTLRNDCTVNFITSQFICNFAQRTVSSRFENVSYRESSFVFRPLKARTETRKSI